AGLQAHVRAHAGAARQALRRVDRVELPGSGSDARQALQAVHVVHVHPLDMLTGEEIAAASDVLRAAGHLDDATYVARVVLDEPTKDELAGGACERRARA